ncbi:hypothetical protein HanRHA438_Chr03g0128191 [Helianthus annuus]|nr:hypothetical protein HanRHA438_Chr03g0128191 [Helianthus annuus]
MGEVGSRLIGRSGLGHSCLGHGLDDQNGLGHGFGQIVCGYSRWWWNGLFVRLERWKRFWRLTRLVRSCGFQLE